MIIKANYNKLLIFLMLIISIMPTWFNFEGHIAKSILLLISLFLTFTVYKKIRAEFSKYIGILFIWIVIRDSISLFHGEYVRSITLALEAILPAYIISKYVNNKRKLDYVIDSLIYLSVIVCILGLIEAFTKNDLFLFFNNSGQVIIRNAERLGIVRIIGFTTQTSHYALYAGMVSLLTFYRIQSVDKQGKMKFLLIYIVQISNMLLTLSRTVMLAYIICILVIMLRSGMLKAIKYYFIALVSVVSVFFILGNTFIGQTFYMLLGSVIPEFNYLVSGVADAEINNPVGDRLELYHWVYNNVRNNFFLGVGETVEFNQEVSVTNGLCFYSIIKTSIEVNYLYYFFHFGFVGMISEIVMYLRFLILSFKGMIKRYQVEKEGTFSFDFIFFIVILLNLLSWFGINQGEEAHTLYIIIGIWISYKSLQHHSRKCKNVFI